MASRQAYVVAWATPIGRRRWRALDILFEHQPFLDQPT